MIKSIATCILFTLLWVNLAFARHPVLIVPGTNDVSANMVSGCLKATMERAGYEVYPVDFPNTGQGFIQEDVKRLKEAIDKITKGQSGAKSLGGIEKCLKKY